MTNWETFKKLCLIIGGQESDALADVIDCDSFPALFALAEERDLLPALATRLDEQNGQAKRLPTEFNEKLTAALVENTRRKLKIKAQAIKLTRALNAQGIEPLLMKGTAQLLTNPDIPAGFRKQVDIDLLVPPNQIDTSCEALKEDGYIFFDFTKQEPEAFTDAARAQQLSKHHHHLPPLGKAGYSATVELHRQPLRRRFQKALPVEQLLKSAVSCEQHDAKFMIPSVKAQLTLLFLGDFIHDGYAARYDFPLRAGCDYIEIVTRPNNGPARMETHHTFTPTMQLFEQLLSELMRLPDEKRWHQPIRIRQRLAIMEKRCNSAAIANLLDLQARWRYLALSMRYDAGKLPGYFNRMRQTPKHESAGTS